MGGELNVKKWNASRLAASGRTPSDRSPKTATTGRRPQSCRPKILSLLAAALLVLSGAILPGGDAQAQRTLQIGGATRTLTVPVFIGKSEDVRTDTSFVEITVGDPEVADVNPLTDRALSILGKKNGTTRVSVYAEGKKLIGVFDVEVIYDTSLLQNEIRKRFPYAKLRVSAVNGRIMLSGSAPDAVTLDRAVMIARQFGPDVINTVEVLSPQQVMLEVRFIEATRQASRELGMQWNSFGQKFNGNIGSQQSPSRLPITPTGPGNPFKQPGVTVGGPNVVPAAVTLSPIVAGGVLSGTAPFGFLISRMIMNGLEIQSLISALEEKGVARSLAEPNLVALSGDTASFLAGGEYPVPVPGALGTVAIEFKKYGVGLAFTPTVLGGGLINMKIEPEVSSLDTSNPVQVAGISVPPLIVRRASTTVELRDGQSFVIGGLLQNTTQNALQQLPWLGDVPVLGALFRSTQYQKNETDLAIIVTPRLVRPARPGDILKTPADTSLPPNDADLFLMGRTEVSPAMARLAAGVRSREFSGHMLDLPKRGANVISVRN
jgi:pilus assembly protein CpaC